MNPTDQNLEEIVISSTSGKGVEVTFECAGAEETLNQALALTRPGGQISLIGHYRATPRFNLETLIINSISLFGPMYGHDFFDEAVKLLLAGEVDFTPLVGHWHPIEKAEEAFETASDADQSVKVLFNL